ncbi:MAG: hypothetical protein LBC71_03845 [Oscillospiraceae bacterium]|jgi:hypothetical protein|nr:hypothetical protein [Oscillospiraceae bacterium]
MESIVALVVLGMLMTTVMSIIAFSLTMTARSIRNSTHTQAEFNELFLGEGFDPADSFTLTISTSDFDVSHDVLVGFVEDMFEIQYGFAFIPNPD